MEYRMGWRNVVELKPRVFRAWWLLIMSLHGLHAIALLFEALKYAVVWVLASSFKRKLREYRLDQLVNEMIVKAMASTSLLLAVWHSVAFVRGLIKSCRSRRFELASISTGLTRQLTTRNGKWTKRGQAWLHFFSMDSAYFDVIRDVRECIEIATQTYAVTRLAAVITSRLENHVAAFALVANCWSTPCVRWLYASQPFRGRFFRLSVGILLACCFTIALPWMLLRQQSQSGEPSGPRFHDLRWVVENGFRLQQALTSSWVDWLSTRIQLVMVTFAMETLKSRIVLSPSTGTESPAAVVPAPTAHTIGTTYTNEPKPTWDAERSSSRANRLRDLGFVCYGTFVLVSHLYASIKQGPFRREGTTPTTNVPTCLIEMRPWFRRQPVCALLKIDCFHQGIMGHPDEVDHALTDIALDDVTSVIFANCRALTVPAQVQEMKALTFVKVENSTFAAWSEAIEFTHESHPLLAGLWLIRVRNLTRLPSAMLSSEFPAVDVEICDSDLAELPSDLHERWRHDMEVLQVERCALTHVPPSLLKMSIVNVSLVGNHITTVPVELFESTGFFSIRLSENPITTLPNWTHDGLSPVCTALFIENTGITSLPRSIQDGVRDIFASGTPLCTDDKIATRPKNVRCEASLSITAFPLDDETL